MPNNNMISLQVIDMAVPIQSFRFEFMAVGRSDLPFMREFILRLLKIGDMSSDQLAKFLGLSEKEIRIATSQLTLLNEVTVNFEGELSLTEEALKYFNSDDARPKMQKLFEGTRTLNFDLLSFKHVHSSERGSGPLRAFSLVADQLIASESTSYARDAFLRGYIDIFEKESFRFDGVDNIRNIEIYKLTDVRKSKDYYIRIPISFSLDVERNSIERGAEHDLLESEKVTIEINKIFSVSNDSSNVKEIAESMEALLDYFSLDCMKSGGLDYAAFAIKMISEGGQKKPMSHFLGSVVIDNNWERISTLLDKHLKKDNKNDLVWVAPVDRYWLRSEDMFQKISSCTEMVHKGKFKLMLPVDDSDDRSGAHSWRKQLGKLKNLGEKYCGGYLGGGVELIIIPDCLAVVVYHLQQSNESITVPFGFITEDSSLVSKILGTFESYCAGYSDDLTVRAYGEL